MKKKLYLFLFLCISQGLLAQVPAFNWVKQIGGIGNESGYKIITDASGNIYTTGVFSETLDFDPGAGVFNLTSAGAYDIFIMKMDATGNFLWAKNMGGANMDYGFSVDLDPLGNIYISGVFMSTGADFDPGPATFNMSSAGGYDIFVCKLDPSGNFLWAKKMGSTGQEDCFSIAVDASGNSYITGKFVGTVDFNPGAGVFNLTSSGSDDSYVCKLDASGNFLWAVKIGGTSIESGRSLKLDASGNVYITGYFTGTCDFDPGPATFNMSTSVLDYNAFILKINSSGNFLWAKQISGNDEQRSFAITIDPSGNVYSTGYFKGSTDFDPGAGVYNLTSLNNNINVYISKLDASGNFIWAQKVDGTEFQTPTGIVTDGAGNAYVIGNFRDSADFDPGPLYNYLTTDNNWEDIFVAKWNSNGSFSWAKNFKGRNNYIDRGESIAVDATGNVYTTGFFVDTVDFDPGPGVHNLISEENTNDIFIHKLSVCSVSSTDTRSECSPYTWIDGVVYTANNTTATWTIPNGALNGCDSVITLNLTIKNSTSSSQTITACNSYTWPVNGTTYTNSTTATHTIPNSVGCDSVITLHLTINHHSSANFNIGACGPYTWPANGVTYTNTGSYTHTIPNHVGCDSVMTLNLEVGSNNSSSQIVDACETYTWAANGTTYTTSGNYDVHYVNSTGCDSTVTLYLTIHYNSSAIQNIVECDSYTWPVNGVTYTNSATTTHTIPNSHGCDSVITLNLTINNSNSATQNVTECDSYTWPVNGVTYANSTTTTHTIPNSQGCDSVITLNLTINHSTSATQNVTGCDSYTWPVNGNTYTSSVSINHIIPNSQGCDSVITLNLTISHSSSATQTVTQCNAYTWPENNVTYTSSTIVSHTIQNSAGCDSVITLNLTITPFTINVTQTGITLTADSGADTYQWIDCNTNSPVPGETSPSYTAVLNGSYAVIASDNGCPDTSACFTINSVGMEEHPGPVVSVYPNPTTDMVTIKTSAIINAQISLIDLTGKTVLTTTEYNADNFILDLSAVRSGIYIIQLKQDENITHYRIVKK